MTFWRYEAPEPWPAGIERLVAGSWLELHRGLLTFPGPLPACRAEWRVVSALLDDPAGLPALPASGRRHLQTPCSSFTAS